MSNRPRILPLFSLQGKVCVVTGGARGLGYVFCQAFVESGCTQIAILDLFQQDCDKTATELIEWFRTESGGETIEAKGFAVDVSNEAAVKETFDAIVKLWGKVDVMVASAGICENYSAFDYPTDRVKKIFDINVHGAFFCAREAAKHMMDKKVKGSIIFIASMSASIVNVPQLQSPYNATKAALKHYAASLAVEWAKEGVRVNSVSPGYMATQLTKNILERNEQLRIAWVGGTPMGRMGDPEDLKGALVYLASDASAFTTGSDLVVDGGYTCL
jgi:NAD(P)-dependent dehydrogenase (short-subunit alcohol dehydrogenase family)